MADGKGKGLLNKGLHTEDNYNTKLNLADACATNYKHRLESNIDSQTYNEIKTEVNVEKPAKNYNDVSNTVQQTLAM